MNKHLFLFCLFTSSIYAQVGLKTLIECDPSTCMQKLEEATTEELWDTFLEGQTELFAQIELPWLSSHSPWNEVSRVLEIGSGNGSYLFKLASQFRKKRFHGIEKRPQEVSRALSRYNQEGLSFQEGDAELFNSDLLDSFDGVLFRLTLQHLENPLIALENAWYYLTPDGYIFIIDSCDAAYQNSHPLPIVNQALANVAELQTQNKKGNRKITLEILKLLEDKESTLSSLYELKASNLDRQAKPTSRQLRLEGVENRKDSFNHMLLFLTLLHRTFHIPIDMQAGYDELKSYLADEEAWTILGMHYLILKKRASEGGNHG